MKDLQSAKARIAELELEIERLGTDLDSSYQYVGKLEIAEARIAGLEQECSRVRVKEKILSAMRPHFCTRDGCGQVPNPRHEGCVEIDSDVFVEACNQSPKVNGVRLAPD